MAEEDAVYYHHTDKESLKKILESKKIKQSEASKGDAVGGDGTYLTKHGPQNSRAKIAKNNFDGINPQVWQNKVKDGKTEVAIEVKLPKKDVVDHSKELGRDVHRYKDDVDLSKADWRVHVRTGDKTYTTYSPKSKDD